MIRLNVSAWVRADLARRANETAKNRADYVHLHSSDKRFCGATNPQRRFTLRDHEVTCPHCKEKM